MNEIREAAEDGVPEKIEDEVGDLLFAAVNLARHLGVNPDSAGKGQPEICRSVQESGALRGGRSPPLERVHP